MLKKYPTQYAGLCTVIFASLAFNNATRNGTTWPDCDFLFLGTGYFHSKLLMSDSEPTDSYSFLALRPRRFEVSVMAELLERLGHPLNAVYLTLVCLALVGGTVGCAPDDDAGALKHIVVVPTLEVGDELAPAYQFVRIDQVVSRNGTAFVLDQSQRSIRAFGADGSFIGEVGRSGGGPGEFSGDIWKIGLLRDTLWVIDTSRRTSYFSALKPFDYLHSDRDSFIEGDTGSSFYPVRQSLELDGGALGFGGFLASQLRAGLVPRFPILRLTRDGETVDTLAWIATAHRDVIVSRGPVVAQPFEDTPLVEYSPFGRRVYIVERFTPTRPQRASLNVIAIAAEGDTLWNRSVGYEPRAIPSSAIDSAREALVHMYRRFGASKEVERALYAPKYWPAVKSLTIDTEERVWLRFVHHRDSSEYLVLDGEGLPIASSILPGNLQIAWVAPDHLWAVVLDDYDVPRLVRYSFRFE